MSTCHAGWQAPESTQSQVTIMRPLMGRDCYQTALISMFHSYILRLEAYFFVHRHQYFIHHILRLEAYFFVHRHQYFVHHILRLEAYFFVHRHQIHEGLEYRLVQIGYSQPNPSRLEYRLVQISYC